MVKKIYREEGIEGFYKGIFPSLVLTLNPVIQFSLYEVMKEYFSRSASGLTAKNIAFMSMFSKFVTTVITYPLMTAKTIIQADEKRTNEEIIDHLYDLLKAEGIQGYFKGSYSL